MKESKRIQKQIEIFEKESDKMKDLKTTQNSKKNLSFNFFGEKKNSFFEKTFSRAFFFDFRVFFFKFLSRRLCLDGFVYDVVYRTLFQLENRK